MAGDPTVAKWEAFKRGLVSASCESDHSWFDEGEIRTLLHDACASGISIDVILACQNACRSQGAFADQLCRVVGKRKRRILAVDDELEFLELLALNFQKAGQGQYEFLTEADPVAAIGVVESFQPDLCIIDLKMPGLDGSELIYRIRAESHFGDMPIIVLTALLDGTAIEAVTKDNVLHLSKPASWKKLFYCVEAHLGNDPDKPSSGLATIDV